MNKLSKKETDKIEKIMIYIVTIPIKLIVTLIAIPCAFALIPINLFLDNHAPDTFDEVATEYYNNIKRIWELNI